MACLRTEASVILARRLKEAGLDQSLRLVYSDNGDGDVTILVADQFNVPIPGIEGVVGKLTVCDYHIPPATRSPVELAEA